MKLLYRVSRDDLLVRSCLTKGQKKLPLEVKMYL